MRFNFPPMVFETPVGNTGSSLQPIYGVCLDWIQGTVSIAENMVNTLLDEFAVTFAQPGCIEPCIGKSFGATRYDNGARSLYGMRFAWTKPNEAGCVSLWFSIPASSIVRVAMQPLVDWLYCANAAYSFSMTRLDFALDDFSKSLLPEDFDAAHNDGNIVGNPNYKKIDSYDERGRGFTRYIGSRESERILRLYDKSIQSNGLINSHRLEVEFKGDKAKLYFAGLLECLDLQAVTTYILESIVGSVDFRDKSVDTCVTRCPRLGWWQKFIDFVSASGGLRLSAPRKVSSFSDTMNWMSRSVSSSLACLHQVFGHTDFLDRINRLVVHGKGKLSTKHIHQMGLLRRSIDELQVIPI